MIVMYFAWMLLRRPKPASTSALSPAVSDADAQPTERQSIGRRVWRFLTYHDNVDVRTVDLKRDEHEEEEEDRVDDERREAKLKGRWGPLWRVYFAVV